MFPKPFKFFLFFILIALAGKLIGISVVRYEHLQGSAKLLKVWALFLFCLHSVCHRDIGVLVYSFLDQSVVDIFCIPNKLI